MMSEHLRKALKKNHQKLRTGIIVKNLLPDLRLHLTDIEYSQVDAKQGNVQQVDELVGILLTKPCGHIQEFCRACEQNGYQDWADQLQADAAAGVCKVEEVSDPDLMDEKRCLYYVDIEALNKQFYQVLLKSVDTFVMKSSDEAFQRFKREAEGVILRKRHVTGCKVQLSRDRVEFLDQIQDALWESNLEYRPLREVIMECEDEGLIQQLLQYENLLRAMGDTIIYHCKKEKQRDGDLYIKLKAKHETTLGTLRRMQEFLVNDVGLDDAIFHGFQEGCIELYFELSPETASIPMGPLLSKASQSKLLNLGVSRVELSGHWVIDIAIGRITYLKGLSLPNEHWSVVRDGDMHVLATQPNSRSPGQNAHGFWKPKRLPLPATFPRVSCSPEKGLALPNEQWSVVCDSDIHVLATQPISRLPGQNIQGCLKQKWSPLPETLPLHKQTKLFNREMQLCRPDKVQHEMISTNAELLLRHWKESKEKLTRMVQRNIYHFGSLREQFLHACCEADFVTARNLLESGCSLSILSREEQEELLRRAFDVSGRFIGDLLVVQALLENVPFSILSSAEKEELLCQASSAGNLIIVDTLITNRCNVECMSLEGRKGLMKKLILAGAKVGMRDDSGFTALHHAADKDHIHCGVLLAEGGANLVVRNNYSRMPLDVGQSAKVVEAIKEAVSFTTRKTLGIIGNAESGKSIFLSQICNCFFTVDDQRKRTAGIETVTHGNQKYGEAIKQAASFTTRKTLCVIGNSEGGKSTLIAALQAEKSSFFGQILNRFRRVDDSRKRTTGIESIRYCSQKYGEVLFFDFAGQHEYHGLHQKFQELLRIKPGMLVVKATGQDAAILHQLHRWLTPVALMASAVSPPQVIVIGSFLDKVKFKEEATAKLLRCIETTKKGLEELPLQFEGTCLLNCHKPQSEGTDQLCKQLEAAPILEFRTSHTQCSLTWVLNQLRSSGDKAVLLQELYMWMEDNKRNFPQSIPPPEEVCQDLTAVGHALYLPNMEDPSKGCLVLSMGIVNRTLPVLVTASGKSPPTPTSTLQPFLSIPYSIASLHPLSSIHSGATARLDTSAAPSLNDVNELIATHVAAKWQNFAIKLGVKDFLIDVISEDHPRSCVAACQDMLKRWLREERHTGGEERTWSTLLTALGRANFGELERSLRGEHFCNTK